MDRNSKELEALARWERTTAKAKAFDILKKKFELKTMSIRIDGQTLREIKINNEVHARISDREMETINIALKEEKE